MDTNELLDKLRKEIDRVQGERLSDAINVNISGESIIVGDDRLSLALSEGQACQCLKTLRVLPDGAGWEAAWDLLS